MAFNRITVGENIYLQSWYIYDSSTGQENKQSGLSNIQIYTNYPGSPGSSQVPTKYTALIIKEENINESSSYKSNYKIRSVNNIYVYIYDRTPDLARSSFNYWEYYRFAQWTSSNNIVPLNDLSSRNFISTYVDVWDGERVILENGKILYAILYDYISITSGRYSGDATLYLRGINNGSHSIQASVTMERCDPEIKDILPASGSFVDDLNGFRISWTLDAPASAAGNVFMPTDIQFQWGTTQSLGNTITLTLDPNSPDSYRGVNIPAKTFPTSGTVYWKIRWKSELEDTYWETDVGTYSTTDSTATVKPVYPVNASIDGEIDNVFQWEYETDTGLPQYAFDFQYSNNDGLSWENLFQHKESTSPSCTVPANTFIAGNGLWKVRGYNTDDVAGEWSQQASIIVRAASKPPVISSVTTTPKVTITWQASGQQAFRLTAKNASETYESGIVFGTGKTFTIPHYWDDGELQIAISIENRFGVWSDEAKTAVIIQNTPSGNISLNGYVEGYGAVLSWRTDTTVKAYYVLRDGIAIACVTDTSYVDRNICGDAVYLVMGVTENGNYTESETLNLYSAPEHAVVGLVDGDDWVELRVNRGGMPEITETHMEDISYQYYSGKMYPVAYSSVFRERTKTFGFTVWKDAAEKLGDLIGQLVILKDYTGGKIIGVLNNLQLSGYVRRPDVSFDITVIDYNEEVSFDV